MSSQFSPSFEIVRQDSLGKEQYSNNSVQKEIHVVAKNFPFVIEVKSSFNLHKVRFYALLCYDNDDFGAEFKQVDYVKQSPMTYKSFVHQNGAGATVEIRLLVLSSHMEDSLFRVKLGIVDPASNTSMELVSDAMRVVSKPALVNKPKKIGVTPKTKRVASPSSGSNTVGGATTTNDSSASSVMDVLFRLEEQQKQQQQLLKRLVDNSSFCDNSFGFASTLSDGCSFVIPTRIPDPQDHDFEKAFHHLLQLYSQLPQHDRPQKLRKVIRECKAPSTCHDLLDTWISSYNNTTTANEGHSQESSVDNSPVSSPASSLSPSSSLFFTSQEDGNLDQLLELWPAGTN